MANQDAKFSGSLFRKDNRVILACRRDKAEFMGARIVYDGADYHPGQVLVRKASDGLFYRFSAASGGSYDSPCVLFDDVLVADFQSEGAPSATGVQAAPLARVLMAADVYTSLLVDYDSNAKTALKSKDMVDAAGVAITKF